MAEPNFRQEEIRSRKYLDASRGQPCTLEITGACLGGTETTIPAHVRDETFGMAQKADDISVVDACKGCHDVFDGRTHMPLTKDEWLFYALRGLQRTLRNRVERGILAIAGQREATRKEPTVKPRKPRAERKPIPSPDKPIQSRGFDQTHSRKMNGTVVRKEATNV